MIRHSLSVDYIACDGRGLCAELLPEMIHLDEWGYPIIDPRPLDPRLERLAQHAVAACPTMALHLRRAADVDPPAGPPGRTGSGRVAPRRAR